MNLTLWIAGCSTFTVALLGCGGDNDGSKVTDGPPGSGASSASGPSTGGSRGIDLMLGGSSSTNPGTGNAGSGASGQVITSLPAGFEATDIGGYKLGEPLGEGGAGDVPGSGGASGSGGAPNGNCGNVLLGVGRDFKGKNEKNGHPDFEASIAGGDVTPNLVASTLGSDKKPVYASQCEIGTAMMGPTCPFGAQTTSVESFDQWYRDTPDVNAPYAVSLYLAPQPGGLFTFQSLHYFPVDGAGFKSSNRANDGREHNFGFTTEIHTQFIYSGGETFKFEGDDDVWVFINDKLAVDLGGLHPKQLRSVNLDESAAELGLEKGTIYPLDLFHAERHTTASTFRIDTNLSFVDCGTVIPGKVK